MMDFRDRKIMLLERQVEALRRIVEAQDQSLDAQDALIHGLKVLHERRLSELGQTYERLALLTPIALSPADARTREEKIADVSATIPVANVHAISYKDIGKRLQLRMKTKGSRRTRKNLSFARKIRRGDRCAWCGTHWREDFHIDHVVAVSRGGSNDLSNLVAACSTCNLSKGSADWGHPRFPPSDSVDLNVAS